MLCLTLDAQSMADNRKLYSSYQDYIDTVELRLDCLKNFSESEIKQAQLFPSEIDKPVILTLRRKTDGGGYTGDEKTRLDILKKVSEGMFSFVDVEQDVKEEEFEENLKKRKIKIIRSLHDFNGIPDNITDIVRITAKREEIPKIAVQINSVSALCRLYQYSQELKDIKEKIIVGMGTYGMASRILYKKFGSMFMYCCTKSGQNGMLCAEKMKKLYRCDSVDENTEIFGVVGNPVVHSKSPNIHNPAFEMKKINAVYLPFTTDSIEEFLHLAELLDIKGFSVTAPFKKDIVEFLADKDDFVKDVGACNTVLRRDGKLYGFNTDCVAAEKLFIDKNIKTALILGAGAVAETTATVLLKKGIDVTVVNRTFAKAEELGKKYGCGFDSLDNVGRLSGAVDLVVQTTSTNEDVALPFEFSGKELVCDMVYNPVKTDFLKRAEQSGCKIITGLDFLFTQGVAQFELFTGKVYPSDLKLFP